MSVNFAKGKAVRVPRLMETGTSNWHRLTSDFTSPPETGKDHVPNVSFSINSAEGEAWFDLAELTELEK